MNIVPQVKIRSALVDKLAEYDSASPSRRRESIESAIELECDSKIDLDLELTFSALEVSNTPKPSSISYEEHASLLRNPKTRFILLICIILTLLHLICDFIFFIANRRKPSRHPFGHLISLLIIILGIVFSGLQLACWILRWETDGNAVFFGGGVILFHFYFISGIGLDYFINHDIFSMIALLFAGVTQLALYVQYRFPNGSWISIDERHDYLLERS